jgi:hypothetical protein
MLLSIRWQPLKWVLFTDLGLAARYGVAFAVVLMARGGRSRAERILRSP